ncbi:MAG: M48 family metallopeptidase [Gammaproteobacteria bacterium]|nr:M48 family metallopeptidase [Gammaproteobacteria bacterium]
MISIRAKRYDGNTSKREEVWLDWAEPGFVNLRGENLNKRYALSEIQLAPPLANLPRELHFADGSLCEVEPSPAIDTLFAPAGSRLLHRWENNLRYAFVALLLTGAVVWLVMEYGIPALSKQVAFALPVSTEEQLGEDTLSGLDRFIFMPSKLSAAKKQQLSKIFQQMLSEPESHYRLEFRASPRIGANALALPSGIVIMTDELVALAKHDEEIIAVLAHELGHVQYRHTLRQVLQNSISGLLIATLTGDILSTSSFAAALPTVLVQTHFARQFETEADDVAVLYLRAHKISTAHFANILLRLTESHHAHEKNVTDYLSTHPSTNDRIQRLRN